MIWNIQCHFAQISSTTGARSDNDWKWIIVETFWHLRGLDADWISGVYHGKQIPTLFYQLDAAYGKCRRIGCYFWVVRRLFFLQTCACYHIISSALGFGQKDCPSKKITCQSGTPTYFLSWKVFDPTSIKIFPEVDCVKS